MSKAKYKTRQMAELLAFLESVQGTHVTVSEICDFFKSKEIAIGMTTVYRAAGKAGCRRSGSQIYCGRNKQCLL